jgi:hypothetical protein
MPDRTDVLRILQSEEPNYRKAASTLGPEVLPELEQLARGPDPLLASKTSRPGARSGCSRPTLVRCSAVTPSQGEAHRGERR